uniref:Reverse transcriptase zinc-binding domain-containing protein n=1 Tax=Lactuca sativa TaxID=4236 RepID=A0A9R1XQI6_LACSA|nr:hypothetical protein LSAT_V11C200082200 [Lactuca sativa]
MWWLMGLNSKTSIGYCDLSSLPQSRFHLFWNNLVPRKVNILVWRVNHSKLPTLATLSKIMCNAGLEDEHHLFFSYPLTKEELLNCNQSFTDPLYLSELNSTISLVFIWVIWAFRNKAIFNGAIKS